VRVDDPEPITVVTLRYEAIIDLGAAATEAGMSSDEFKTALGKSIVLRRALGALLAKGGTVQRDAFQTAFPDLAREFKLGDETNPHATPTTVVGQPFAGHTASILAVALSPDGKRAISGSEDKTLRLWDVETGRELRRFEGHTGPVSAVAFAGQDAVISGSHDRSVRLWDLKTGKELKRFDGHTDRVTCVVAHDKSLFASGSQDRTIRLWKLDPKRPEVGVLTGHRGTINAVAFNADATCLASGGSDRSVRLWRTYPAAQSLLLEGHAAEVHAVRFVGEGFLASGGGDRTVRVWSIKGLDGATPEGKEMHRLEGALNAVIALGHPANEDGKHVWSCSSQYQQADKFFRKWDVAAGKEVAARGGNEKDRVSIAAFAPDGRWALTDSVDNGLRLWKLE